MKTAETIKLAVTGSFGYQDIGDEAMLTEDLDFILNFLKISRENIYLIGGDPQYISSYHNHPLGNCIANRQFLCRLSPVKLNLFKRIMFFPSGGITLCPQLDAMMKSSDALLVTGGGTINTRDKAGYSLRMIHSIVAYFRRINKPIFISGQTIGPLGVSAKHDRLAAQIINSADFLTVRDDYYSRMYIQKIKARPKQFVETIDDAVALAYKQEVVPDEIDRFLRSKDTAAVNVTSYTADTAAKKSFICRLCEYLIRGLGFNVILLGMQAQDYADLSMIRDMLDKSCKPSVMLADTRGYRDKLVKKIISRCRLAIGGRYHFVVFAASSDTPFLGMCDNRYSYIKQDGFTRQFGLGKFTLSEKETWDMEVIKSRIQDSLSLKLGIEGSLKRPGVSMMHFGDWLKNLYF